MTEFVGVILLDKNGRVALQLREEDRQMNPGMWSVFGGHLEEGERPEDGALREIGEELSVALDSDKLTLLGKFEREDQVFHIYYYPVIEELDHAVLREGQAWRWCSPEEIRSGLKEGERVVEYHARFLGQFFQDLTG